MGQFIDMIGKRFGRLVAIRPTASKSPNGTIKWEFACDCGATVIIDGSSVRNGNVKSCGCYHSECAKKVGTAKRVHGKQPQRLYNIWCGMKARCGNPNNPKYAIYGKRGIGVCDEWVHDFGAFRDWALDNGYKDELQIDRIDVDKGYSPENCRWATAKQQQRNRRNNHMLRIGDRTVCVAECAELLGINHNTFKNWVRINGLDPEAIMREKHEYNKTRPYKHGKVC